MAKINGTNGDDAAAAAGALIGTSLDDVIRGHNGNDELFGEDGNDTLFGGRGNDALFGGDGDDELSGGQGDDMMTGGTGMDLFRVGRGPALDGNDTITDYNPHKGVTVDEGDTLQFGAPVEASDLGFSYVLGEVNGNANNILATVVNLGGQTLTLEDISIPTYSQGFEAGTAGWLDSDDGWFGQVARVASGTDGIASADGGFHAIFTQSGPLGAETGAFTRFDGYSANFRGEYAVQTDIYLDTAMLAGEGFDYSVASNGSNGAHLRDFIFHVAKDASTGDLLVAGSNNTGFDPRTDLETIDNFDVNVSGWYTFEHRFYDNGAGELAVDLNLYDSNDILLFTETRSDPSDLIASNVGGNRYGWFTNIDVTGGIAVDNVSIALEDTGFVFA